MRRLRRMPSSTTGALVLALTLAGVWGSLSGMPAEGAADPAAPTAAPAGGPDPISVLVAVDCAPSMAGPGTAEGRQLFPGATPENAKAALIRAITSSAHSRAASLGGLKARIAADPQTIKDEANQAGAGSILLITILDRKAAFPSSGMNRSQITVQASLLKSAVRPTGKGGEAPPTWTKVFTRKIATDGPLVPGLAEIRDPDCTRMAEELGSLLLAVILPQQVVGANMTPQGGVIAVAISNPTRYTVRKLRLAVPYGNMYGPTQYDASDEIGPGEKKTVTFTIGLGGSHTYLKDILWKDAKLCSVEFK